MNKKSSIAVIGSSNTDMVIMTSRFPAPGETILGGEFFMNAGGKGANQAVAAARCGGKVSFIGKLGRDIFGDLAAANIESEGIDVSALSRDPDAASGVAQITVDRTGENSIVVAAGANLELHRSDIDQAIEQIRKADIVLMQLEVPIDTVLYAARKAHEMGKRVMLNPAPAMALPDELFNYLFMLTPNESETERLTGITVRDASSAGKAARSLQMKGVENIVITMGSEGAFVYADQLNEIVPAFEVTALDTTAAGDCFNGVLAVEIGSGAGLLESVRFANRAAAIAVTRPGAQDSLPMRDEVENSLRC